MTATEILAIDPGSTESAWLVYRPDQRLIRSFGKHSNDMLLAMMTGWAESMKAGGCVLVVEMIASYGMPVGREVFETCAWIGRYVQAWDGPYSLLYRREVKLHLCGSPRAKDSNIRQALLDKFGPQGTKAAPGMTYGIKADIWAALAVAATFVETGCKVVRLGASPEGTAA